MMKKWTGLGLALLLLIALAGCGGSRELPSQVTVTYVKSPLNVPTMVERSEGIFQRSFAEVGVDVAYAEITNGAEQTQALASGDVQFLFAVGAPSVILAAANGLDIRIIGAYSSAPGTYQIVTGSDDIRSAADLAGRTVAGPKGTTLHELLAAYLAQDGLTVEDVDYVAMSIGDAQAALEAGQVDVALLAGANAYRAGQAGYRVLTDGVGLIDGTVLVAAAQSFCDAYPELVERFLAAHRAVLDQIKSDPETALTIAETETGLERGAVEEMYALYDFHAALTEQDLHSLEGTKNFMLDAGMIEQDFAVADILWNAE